MTALIITVCVVGGIAGWLFCAATAVRWLDLASKKTWGLDGEDRFLAWMGGIALGPLALMTAVLIRVYRGSSKNTFIHDFTHPKEVKYEARQKKADELRQQSSSMERMARQATDEAEKKILADAARSLRSQANAL